MKNYNQLFQERFHKSQLIDEKFVRLRDNEGLKSGIDYLKSIGATQLDYDYYQIKYRISKWTQNDLTEEENFLKELLNIGIEHCIINVKIGENAELHIPEVTIETTNGVIRAMKLSSYKPNIKQIIPNIEEKNRFGNCYKYAYDISLRLPMANNLTTGYIYGYSDKSKFLHSWVETNINNEDYVIDATLNAIINKDGYYLMQRAKPITKIDNKTLKADLNKYPVIDNKNVPLEVYYVFRDEIVKELENRKDELER